MLIVRVQANENFDTSLRLITRTRASRRAFIELLYVELVFGLIFEGLVTDSCRAPYQTSEDTSLNPPYCVANSLDG